MEPADPRAARLLRRAMLVAVAVTVAAVTIAVGFAVSKRGGEPPVVATVGSVRLAPDARFLLELSTPSGWVAASPSSTATSDELACRSFHVEDRVPVCDAVLKRHLVASLHRSDDARTSVAIFMIVGARRGFDDGERGTSVVVRGHEGVLLEHVDPIERALVWDERSRVQVVMLATGGDAAASLPTGEELTAMASGLREAQTPARADLPLLMGRGDTVGSWVQGRGKWYAALRQMREGRCIVFGPDSARGMVRSAESPSRCVEPQRGRITATLRVDTELPGQPQARVVGAAPPTAARVRIDMVDGKTIEGPSVATDRGFTVFAFDVPPGWTPESAVGIDADGRALQQGDVATPPGLDVPVDDGMHEVARGEREGIRWAMLAGARGTAGGSGVPGARGTIRLRLVEPSGRSELEVAAPSSAEGITTTVIGQFAAGTAPAEATRVTVQVAGGNSLETTATVVGTGSGRLAAVWVADVAEQVLAQPVTITAYDADDHELARDTVQLNSSP